MNVLSIAFYMPPNSIVILEVFGVFGVFGVLGVLFVFCLLVTCCIQRRKFNCSKNVTICLKNSQSPEQVMPKEFKNNIVLLSTFKKPVEENDIRKCAYSINV